MIAPTRLTSKVGIFFCIARSPSQALVQPNTTWEILLGIVTMNAASFILYPWISWRYFFIIIVITGDCQDKAIDWRIDNKTSRSVIILYQGVFSFSFLLFISFMFFLKELNLEIILDPLRTWTWQDGLIFGLNSRRLSSAMSSFSGSDRKGLSSGSSVIVTKNAVPIYQNMKL